MARIPLPDAARELFGSDAVAHVVTIERDGGPQVTTAWGEVDGDEIVLATLADRWKLRNLRRDPRIALSIQKWPEALVVLSSVFAVQRLSQAHRSDALGFRRRDGSMKPSMSPYVCLR